MGLSSQSMGAAEVSETVLHRMYELMKRHYENTSYSGFQKDLREKDTILILKDGNQEIQGFTTLKAYRMTVDGKPVNLVFSGDTIIDKAHWGEPALHKAWIRQIHSMFEDATEDVYWLLISKGYKTYRFLPVYFRTFFPNARAATPDFERRVIHSFCCMKYPDHYDPERGILTFGGTRDFLRPGVADVTERHRKDTDIAFFLERNPGYLVGDEMVCLTRLNKANIKPRGLRYLEEPDQ